MNDPFAKVAIGDPVRFQAQLWNAMIDAAQANQKSKHGQAIASLTTTRSTTIVRIKNETGTNLARGSILGLDGPIFTPADTNLDIFWREVCFRGIAPTLAQHRRRYAVILQAALGDSSGYGYDSGGQIVMAAIAGVCPVQIDVLDVSHDYANITDGDSTKLTSSRHGHARILWREGEGSTGYEPGYGYGYDTGLQWAIVMLGVTGSSGAVGRASGNISPRSGSTYGTGTVHLYHSNAGSEDGPIETIDVLNASETTFSSGNGIDDGMYCSIEWDADDTAWVAPLECEAGYY